jgi:hypothetical protein
VAAATDGTVAVTWAQYRNDVANKKINSNVYLALLDGASGDLIFGPVSLTNDSTWYEEGTPNFRTYVYPSLVSTLDDRYFISWVDERNQQEVSTVKFAIYASSGQQIKPVTTLAQSAVGVEYTTPAQTPLAQNRVLVTYSSADRAVEEKVYSLNSVVVDSDGNIVKAPAAVAGASGWKGRALQLGSGAILIAWTDRGEEKLAYALLNASTYEIAKTPEYLPLVGFRRPDNISLTADLSGRGVLTWMDTDWNDYLYYALMDENGTLITPPMAYITSQTGEALIQSSSYGLGSAAYGGAWQITMPIIIR